MTGPTEQKERKTIQEEGELAAAFNLADKEGNFKLHSFNVSFKNNISSSCHTLYES